MAPTVVIAHDIFFDLSVEREILKAVDARVLTFRELVSPEAVAAARTADALMVSVQKVPAELLASMTHCRIVSRVGVGVDSIDVAAATARGIWVTNVPDYGVEEVSTHTIALLLACARRIPQLIESTRRGEWDSRFVQPFRRLQGQVLGLVGLGRIGRSTAAKARGLGLQVVVSDPYVDAHTIEAEGMRAVDLETLLRISDFVSLHVPLTETTRDIIDARAMKQMKPTAFLINTSRGGLINEQALLQALQADVIAGAALDVVMAEPPPPDHPLLHEKKAMLTPHTAWYSEDASHDLRVRAAEEVVRVLQGQPPRSPVNHIVPKTDTVN